MAQLLPGGAVGSRKPQCAFTSGLRRRSGRRAAGAPPPRAADELAAASATLEAAAASSHNLVATVAAARGAAAAAPPPGAPPPALPLPPAALAAGAAALAAAAGAKWVLDTPSRKYDANVGAEYDAWTEEGILEYYWGEHIHLGYYTRAERDAGYLKKDFKQAKVDFVDRMLEWAWGEGGGAPADRPPPARILDVGCGIGGTSRMLAARFPGAQVTGITLSAKQAARAQALADARGLANCRFVVMDALAMTFPEGCFDLVWACESGEHMPDKGAYVREMARVLAPGGTLAVATWCQRDDRAAPFSHDDRARLQFLYDEWAHPFFVSKEEYGRLAAAAGLRGVAIADWANPTTVTWRHSNWVGVWDPWPVVFRGPRIWYKTVREIVTLERFYRAFRDGLMEYGMLRARKPAPGLALAPGVVTEPKPE